MRSNVWVRRVDFGYFVRPAEETLSGTAHAEPVLGYLVGHPQGLLLFDTGMGKHPDVDAHYRPRRISLPNALRVAGLCVDDISVVVNCHLHFDHCGGNPALSGRPIFVQTTELANAHGSDYTLPGLTDAPGLFYEQITGQAQVWDGVTIVPTPGHTSGHQSVIVRRNDGTVIVLAGQSHESASDFSTDSLALRAFDDCHDQTLSSPAWMRLLHSFDPAKVYFAHDHAVWTPA